MHMRIRDFLQENILLCDGAMGTYYNEIHPKDYDLVEKLNTSNPEQIEMIHRAYLDAGARLLRTNSFATNPRFFEDEEDRLTNLRASYRIANTVRENFLKENPSEEVFVACDIGTIFNLPLSDSEDILQQYQNMLLAFYEEGGRIFFFETQSDMDLLLSLTTYLKSLPDETFVLASFSMDKTGFTKTGLGIDRMMRTMALEESVDAYGLNCDMDALHMLQTIENLTYYTDKPFLTLPNAGYPYIMRGRPIYAKNESYFSEQVEKMVGYGANILGGCCGTSPKHIEKLSSALDSDRPSVKIVEMMEELEEKRTYSSFYKKLKRGEKAYIVELDPPFDTDASKVFEGAKILKDHKVDLLTLSDSPMGRTRMDASILACMIQSQVGIQVMPHIACRDRNMIGLRSLMLGDYYAALRHFLIVTGDPVPQKDRSSITPVFDFNSIRFMNLIQQMNEDVFAADRVVYGGALNYHGKNADAIARRMMSKMEQGCSYFLTQPVYSKEDIMRLSYLKEKTGAKICAGIMPLVSYKNAVFMANQMPGIHIPDEVVSAYREDMTREEAEDVAIDISLTIARGLQDIADAYYFMTPFNRVELIARIIERIREELEA